MTKTAPPSQAWFGRRDPDRRGYFGTFGGRFVPETLVAPIQALEQEYLRARQDPDFRDRTRTPADALRWAADAAVGGAPAASALRRRAAFSSSVRT